MEKINGSNSHASSTPACDGKRVYVYFGSFGLLAYDLDGGALWRKALPLPEIEHGSASSPILAGDLVVINCDQKEDPYLLALDRATGEQVWRSKRPVTGTPHNYSTPVLWKHGQEAELVILGRRRLMAYDLEDGRERWWVQGFPGETASTPVYTGELIFAMATAPFTGDPVNPVESPSFKELLEDYDANGDGRLVQAEIPEDLALLYRIGPAHTAVKNAFPMLDGNKDGHLSEEEWKQVTAEIAKMPVKETDVFLAVRGGGQGDVTESHVQWRTSEGIGQVASPLVYRGRVYLVKEGGNVTCFHVGTGERIYSEKLGQRAYYFASPVAADGKIYFCSYLGTVFVVEAGDKFKTISQTKLGERIKATPALVGGDVYLRTAKYLMAFGDSSETTVNLSTDDAQVTDAGVERLKQNPPRL
jgi:outer membrane protein assembly factor BamB